MYLKKLSDDLGLYLEQILKRHQILINLGFVPMIMTATNFNFNSKRNKGKPVKESCVPNAPHLVLISAKT
jgi:hypothetical protein